MLVSTFIVLRFYKDEELLDTKVHLVNEKNVNDYLSNDYAIDKSEYQELLRKGEIIFTKGNSQLSISAF